MKTAGNLIVVAAPSGAGKTSLVAALVAQVPDLVVSVSHTTRPKRPAEVDGENYHFVSDDAFNQQIEQQAFLEHALVYGCQYGTSRHWVEAQLEAGQDVVLEIDWQGALQAKAFFPDAVMIYVLPPSLEALAARLQSRQQDDSAVIDSRLAEAQADMVHYDEFDYVVINQDFELAVTEMAHIVLAQRLSVKRQAVAERELLASLLEKR